MTTPVLNLVSLLHGCRLGSQQLDALFSVAGQGFQPGEIEFSHERNSRTFTAPTLADLIAAVRAAPLPGDPDHYDNLKFTATDPAGRRTVTMELTPKAVATRVTGTDATLVYGADSQIRIFLTDRSIGGAAGRTELSTGRSWLVVLATGVLTPLMAALLFINPGHVFFDKGSDGLRMLVVGAFLPLVLEMWWWLAKSWTDRGVLTPTRILSTGSRWARLSTGERIAASGVLVALLAAIGTLISAGADILK
ncbi:hypothetical protein [Streptomyces erythrochromogenes]|uniref:hypothetical protein n=1 Tax=Streptomyces erythrochromogenes TaxID=285574 RepID=UPI0033E30539